MKKPHKENVIAWILFVFALAVAAGLAYAIALVVAPIDVSLAETSFTVKCLYHTETIAYDEIESVSLSTDYAAKTKKGYGGQAKEFGVYTNDALGSHYRLTYTENERTYIVVIKKDGSAFVFNRKTESKTRKLFDDLQAKLSA